MKGISPLLAAVLLIAVTVAIATLVAGWVSTTVRTTQTTITNKTSEAVDCSAAAIVIDDVYAASGTVTARVIVRNAGQTDDLTIQSAQLYNTSGSNFTASSMPITDVDKGEVNTLSFAGASIASCPTSFSQIFVTTSCGGVSAIWNKPPKCS